MIGLRASVAGSVSLALSNFFQYFARKILSGKISPAISRYLPDCK
jgi:hypothetical protein